MEQETTTNAQTPEFVRPTEGRLVAGVAKGLADRFNIPDWIVRVTFCVTLFAFGLGLVLYLSIWALTRGEDETEPPATRFFSKAGSPQSWVGIGLIFVALLVLLDNFTWFSRGVIWAGALLVIGVLLYGGQLPVPGPKPAAPPEDGPDHKEGVQRVTTPVAETSVDVSPVATLIADETAPVKEPKEPKPPKAPKPPRERSILGRLTIGIALLALGGLAMIDVYPGSAYNPTVRHYLALATVVLGLGLLVGSVWGRARWLLLVAAVLVPSLLMTPFTDYWQAQGSHIRPTSFTELQSSYTIDVGRLTVDLGGLPWNGEDVELEVSADVGEVTVVVPFDVAVSGTASLDVGRISVPGHHTGWSFTSRTVDFDHPGYPEAECYDFQTDTSRLCGDGTIKGTVFIVSSVDVGSIQIYQTFFQRNSQ